MLVLHPQLHSKLLNLVDSSRQGGVDLRHCGESAGGSVKIVKNSSNITTDKMILITFFHIFILLLIISFKDNLKLC